MRTCFNGSTSKYATTEQDIAAAAAAGFDALELKSWKIRQHLETKRDVKDIRSLLDDTGLGRPTLGPYNMIVFGEKKQRERSFEEVQRYAEVAAQLEIAGLVILCDRLDGPMDDKEACLRIAETATRYAQSISPMGVDLGLEPQGGHPAFNGPLQARQVLDCADASNIKVVMDTFQYYKGQVTREQIDCIPMEKLLVVHIGDCENLPLQYLDKGHHLYPGLGVVPISSLLQPVIDSGYEGFFSVEAHRQEYWDTPVEQVCKMAMFHLKNLISHLESPLIG